MKILYVAKHNSGGNDDEGAITHALESLGHRVFQLHERRAHLDYSIFVEKPKPDLMLCHNWQQFDQLQNCEQLPKVFWYFDLVDYPDPFLKARNQARMQWITHISNHFNYGFLTDGNYVQAQQKIFQGYWKNIKNAPSSFSPNVPIKTSNHLFHLPQGFDNRQIYRFDHTEEIIPLLFFGEEKNAGIGRNQWLNQVKVRFPDLYHYKRGIHQQMMRERVQQAKIILAPNHPIHPNYWSNRVYLMLGYGGFLLHPYCEGLTKEFTHLKEIVYYNSLEEMINWIDYFLPRKEERLAIAKAGYTKVIENFTYRNRVEKLLQTVNHGC